MSLEFISSAMLCIVSAMIIMAIFLFGWIGITGDDKPDRTLGGMAFFVSIAIVVFALTRLP